ncbi:hypothetical protein ACJBS2_04080 [Streptococcus suis]|uniref:hypothetical protein n=1 Tax=Streptococcus suis TaxID=1307 RepID=UPI001F05347F|nr:hypothetical protein [Streptococcus suis]MCH1674177.1 hypothetical protein [Streptococcus suis]
MKKILDYLKRFIIEDIVPQILIFLLSSVYLMFVNKMDWNKYKIEILSSLLFSMLVSHIVTWIIMKRRIILQGYAVDKIKSISLILEIRKECEAKYKFSSSSKEKVSDFFEQTRKVEQFILKDTTESIEKILKENIFSKSKAFELKYYILDKNLSFYKSEKPSESVLLEYRYSLLDVRENFNENIKQLHEEMRECIVKDKEYFMIDNFRFYPLSKEEPSEGRIKKIFYGFLAIKINVYTSSDIKSIVEKICIEKSSVLVYYLDTLSALSFNLSNKEKEFDFLKELTARRFK